MGQAQSRCQVWSELPVRRLFPSTHHAELAFFHWAGSKLCWIETLQISAAANDYSLRAIHFASRLDHRQGNAGRHRER